MYINNDIDYIKYLSKKEVVIFGAGENGKTNFFRLSKNNIKIVAFCDNDKEKQNHLISASPFLLLFSYIFRPSPGVTC